MLKRFLTAAALLALAACNPTAPQNDSGVQAPEHATQSQPPETTARQAQLNEAERAQLEQLIVTILDGYGGELAQNHMRAPGLNDEIAALQPGRDHQWQVNLRRGVAYRILGACDNECNDVDLELLDPSGAVVVHDRLADDYPLLNITPATDARYTVRIILKTCTLAPCYVGARVLQPSGGANTTAGQPT